MTFGLRLYSWINGRYVGTDRSGNQYYEAREWFTRAQKHLRRWVLYNGDPEPSKVCADWHHWLHHVEQDKPLVDTRYSWEKPHQQNTTGTQKAYFPTPPTHTSYESWAPNEKDEKWDEIHLKH